MMHATEAVTTYLHKRVKKTPDQIKDPALLSFNEAGTT